MDYLVLYLFDFKAGFFSADGTFPDNADPPALFLKVLYVFCIPFFVALKFLFPEFLVGFWEDKILAVFVSVPETSVDKNHRIVSGKYKVRFPWISFVANSVADACPKKCRANLLFGFCIL